MSGLVNQTVRHEKIKIKTSWQGLEPSDSRIFDAKVGFNILSFVYFNI